jgi:hypothetical protein
MRARIPVNAENGANRNLVVVLIAYQGWVCMVYSYIRGNGKAYAFHGVSSGLQLVCRLLAGSSEIGGWMLYFNHSPTISDK